MTYVAGNSAGNQFAVSVRGTDWSFWLDWVEDFDNFLSLTQYSMCGRDKRQNRARDRAGLPILLAINDGTADLKTFITTKARAAQILVTGHSLGGCLAAALAPCIAATWLGGAAREERNG